MPNPLWESLSRGLLDELEAGVPVTETEVVKYTMTLGSDDIADAMKRHLVAGEFPGPIKSYSKTEINHAYHLSMFLSRHPISPSCVVEWGGGYGVMAKIMKTVFPGVEYHLIDLPGPRLAQQRFLEGIPSVFFWSPECLYGPRPEGDLFVSTWAMSESSADEQDAIVATNWFDCANLLLAYQSDKDLDGFPDVKHFEAIIERESLDVLQVPVYDDKRNWYAFR